MQGGNGVLGRMIRCRGHSRDLALTAVSRDDVAARRRVSARIQQEDTIRDEADELAPLEPVDVTISVVLSGPVETTFHVTTPGLVMPAQEGPLACAPTHDLAGMEHQVASAMGGDYLVAFAS
jgi:hypothetical protein